MIDKKGYYDGLPTWKTCVTLGRDMNSLSNWVNQQVSASKTGRWKIEYSY